VRPGRGRPIRSPSDLPRSLMRRHKDGTGRAGGRSEKNSLVLLADARDGCHDAKAKGRAEGKAAGILSQATGDHDARTTGR